MTKTGSRLVASSAAANADALALDLVEINCPEANGGCVVEVAFAAINPSDVKACLGMMPSAVFPRSPGRDFSGHVVSGPANMLGVEVWGTGGDVGISRDGSHARYLWLEKGAVIPKPERLSLSDAAGVGVPFVTAMHGFMDAGGIQPGDVVLVLGANGKVGQAAVQIALWHNARVIAVTRGRKHDLDYIVGDIIHLDATSDDDLGEAVRAATAGHGADLVYNTVGSPYWLQGNAALAKGGRHIFISTVERAVPFDIFAFYRGRHRFIGVDSLALDARESGRYLKALSSGFNSGQLQPFPLEEGGILSLSEWRKGYITVLTGARRRILFDLAS
jgi:NADPH:quinone reductase